MSIDITGDGPRIVATGDGSQITLTVTTGGGGGGFDGVHNDLAGRSTSNAHPASAISGLAAVATTGQYSDLSGRPTLGTAAAADTTAFATSAQGGLAATAVQPGSLAAVATTGQYSDLSGRPTLAAVATSGAYSDLSGRPTLGTAAAADTTAFATSAQGGLADTAVQPGTLAAVATTGQYSDLSGAPTLAAVATTGQYSDLSGTPTLVTLTNSTPAGLGTAAVGTSSDAARADHVHAKSSVYTYGTAAPTGGADGDLYFQHL